MGMQRRRLPPKPTYTIPDVMRALGVSEKRVRNALQSGELEAYRSPGGQRFIPAALLRQFVAEHGLPVTVPLPTVEHGQVSRDTGQPSERVYTLPEVAQLLGVSHDVLPRAIRRGVLRATRWRGRHYRITERDLVDYLKASGLSDPAVVLDPLRV